MRRTSGSGGSCPTQGCTFPGWHERGQRHAPPTTLAWHSVIRDTNGSFCPESPTRRAADEVAPTSISGRDTGHQYCQHPESGRLEGVKTTLKGSPPACLSPAASSFCPGPGSFSTRTFFHPTQGHQSLCQLRLPSFPTSRHSALSTRRLWVCFRVPVSEEPGDPGQGC